MNELPKFGLTVIYASMCAIFIPSFFGSLVTYKGELIADSIYQSDWITMDESTKINVEIHDATNDGADSNQHGKNIST